MTGHPWDTCYPDIGLEERFGFGRQKLPSLPSSDPQTILAFGFAPSQRKAPQHTNHVFVFVVDSAAQDKAVQGRSAQHPAFLALLMMSFSWSHGGHQILHSTNPLFQCKKTNQNINNMKKSSNKSHKQIIKHTKKTKYRNPSKNTSKTN